MSKRWLHVHKTACESWHTSIIEGALCYVFVYQFKLLKYSRFNKHNTYDCKQWQSMHVL